MSDDCILPHTVTIPPSYLSTVEWVDRSNASQHNACCERTEPQKNNDCKKSTNSAISTTRKLLCYHNYFWRAFRKYCTLLKYNIWEHCYGELGNRHNHVFVNKSCLLRKNTKEKNVWYSLIIIFSNDCNYFNYLSNCRIIFVKAQWNNLL